MITKSIKSFSVNLNANCNDDDVYDDDVAVFVIDDEDEN